MTAFPEIEAELIDFTTPVAAVHVGTTVPADRPAEFVRLWVTGGSASQRMFERPTITVQAWAETGVAASAIASRCREAYLTRFGAANELTRPHFDPDPGTGIPRYTFTFRARNRATE